MTQQEHKDISLERIIFFSDAVFAIAITILVLEIRLPEGIHNLGSVIVGMIPRILAYIFGFLQIAIFWTAHHTLFKKIVRYDSGLVWLNFIYLMIIAFLPVPVAAFIELGITAGSIIFIYACLALLGIIEWLVWSYVSNTSRNLLHQSVTRQQKKIEENKIIAVIILFALGIPIAFFNPYVSVLIGIIVPFTHQAIERKSRRAVKANSGSESGS